MKKQIPIFIVFLTGIIMVIQYFVPHGFSEFIFTYANDFVIVIGILALVGSWQVVSLASVDVWVPLTCCKATFGQKAKRLK